MASSPGFANERKVDHLTIILEVSSLGALKRGAKADHDVGKQTSCIRGRMNSSKSTGTRVHRTRDD